MFALLLVLSLILASAWAVGRIPGTSKGDGNAKNECVACSEIRNTVQVPCQHHYCEICVTRLVRDSIVDESLFPPRCCGQKMPSSLLRPYMTAELTAEFELKTIEFGTPHRTYCYFCGKFINPDDVDIQGHRAHCMVCNLDTCICCNGRYHDEACAKDPALAATIQLAKKKGWQRCMNCQTMIERREGCNHMTYVKQNSKAVLKPAKLES